MGGDDNPDPCAIMTNDLPSSSASPVTPQESSLGTRLTNVFVSPGEVFAEIKATPVRHSNWLVAGLVFVILSWIGNAVMFSQENIRHQLIEIQDQALQKKFQKPLDEGKMTQAQVDQMKATVAKFAGVGQIIGGIAGPLFGAAVAPFLGGFMLWLMGRFIFRQPFEYLKAVEASGLTLVIAGLGALVKGMLCAAMGSLFVSPGLVLLVRPYDHTNLLHTSLLAFDVFAIWGIVVTAVALAKLSSVSLVKAFIWVALVSAAIIEGMLALGWAAQRLTGN